MQRIRIVNSGKLYNLTDCCRWEIRDGVLWNLNRDSDEGVDGDIVEYTDKGVRYRGHVDNGPTCFQFIHTKEWGGVVLSAQEYDAKFTHLSKVEMFD